MSDLRDALVNAGIVGKKQAKHAERQVRKKKKKKKKKKSQVDEVVDARPTEAEIAAAAAERKMKKTLEIVDEGLIEDAGGRRRFYFVARNEVMPYLQLSDVSAVRVQNGMAAIVEDPRDPEGDHLVVTRDAAIKLLDVDPEAVRFFMRGS